MSSSPEEILEAFKPFTEMGKFMISPTIKEDKYYKVLYDKLGTLNEVFSPLEWNNAPFSKNMQEAVNDGCKTGEEIIEYCKKIKEKGKEEAALKGENIIVDSIGLLWCQDPNEDCSWDMVYEVVTPEGEILYKREHCY
ncbi:hypothetical protein [uncultured Clostridium sp.]|uniref:hypothetical protein n=1 Tax=uncultured Clostridium sp. TaxID=59620 RepID=UPI00258C2B87|nr:hypothetical protein [uncultured Clostridium sp.]MDU1350576.1 hypothetical protein [Clostridium argentinense]